MWNAAAKAIGAVTKPFIAPVTDIVKEYVVDKDKQIEMQHKLESVYLESVNAARLHDKATYGITFVDAVRGLVRPVITMFSMALFAYCKIEGIALTELDYAMIGSPMAFWFGGRFINKDSKNVI